MMAIMMCFFDYSKALVNFLKNLRGQALGLPETFTCPQRSVAEGIEGLCMVLKRMSFPCRFSDMIYRFGRPVPVLSMVTKQVIDYIYQTHGHRLTQWNNLLLNPAALQTYADAIVRKGAPLENCFGFVDGTVRPICRPNEHQSTVYNGHKRVHALKFQSVTIPNGLIANLYGPVGKKGIHLCNGLFPQYCYFLFFEPYLMLCLLATCSLQGT